MSTWNQKDYLGKKGHTIMYSSYIIFGDFKFITHMMYEGIGANKKENCLFFLNIWFSHFFLPLCTCEEAKSNSGFC